MRNPERFYFKKETERKGFEVLEDILERSKEYLEKTSLFLNQKGFLVDKNCRIDLEKLKKEKKEEFSPWAVERDQKSALQRKKEIEKEHQKLKDEKRFEELYKEKVGEVVERLKTISFNQFWFKEKFFALRTSLYDDYRNQIDELILDPKKPRVIAVIDITSKKEAQRQKGLKWLQRLKNPDSIKVEYGVFAKEVEGELKIEYRALKRIPLLILVFDESPESLSLWLKAIEKNDEKYLQDLLKKELENLIFQCQGIQNLKHLPKELRREYQELAEVFSKLKEK